MDNIQEKLDNALDFINEEDFIAAQKLLHDVVMQDKNNIEAIKNLGLCEINLDNPPDAIKMFEKALEINENDATSRFYLANCLSRIGQKEQAVVEYKKVIELRPEYIDAYKSLAMMYVEFNQVDDAIELCYNVVNNSNIEADYMIYYIISTCFLLKKDNEKAIENLEKAHLLNKTHVPIINSLATCYINIKRYDDAEKLLMSAYDIDANNSLTTYNLGILYQAQQNYQNALKYFQMSYQIEPSNSVLVLYAKCAMMAEEYVLACVLYRSLVSLNENNSKYRKYLIESLEKTKQYKEALENVEFLLDSNPKDVELNKKRGTYLRKLGYIDDAIDTFEQLINRGKIDVEVYYNLAFCFASLLDYDNAKEMLKKCIILEPENPYAHKDLGVVYLKMNCYDWAVDEMNKAIAIDSNIAEFHYSLGVSYMMLSKVDKAKEALTKAVMLNPKEPDSLAFLGYAYLCEKDYEKSYSLLEAALKIDSNNFLAKSHMAKYYYQLQKYSIAKEFLKDIIEKTKDDESTNMLADCYLHEEDYKSAMGLFYKLSVKYPENHIILTNLAKCEHRCDKDKEALEHIRKALMIFDDYQEALKLLKEINDGK